MPADCILCVFDPQRPSVLWILSDGLLVSASAAVKLSGYCKLGMREPSNVLLGLTSRCRGDRLD
jgi:hypothetical protein